MSRSMRAWMSSAMKWQQRMDGFDEGGLANPDDAVTLGAWPGCLAGVPRIIGSVRVAAGVALRKCPFGLVRGDLVTERLVLFAVRGEHADEATTPLVDVGHVRPCGSFREVPAASQGDEFFP